MIRHLIATLLLVLLPALAQAQAAATLVADSVFVPAGGQSLVAEGNVEVFFDGTRLSAQRITFDRASDSLIIDGPIFIVGRDGVILSADAASLDPQLKNGILRGARLVLNEQLQLAANQIDRVDGRFTQLYQVAATSCHICADGETPLWEIRARRVVHDTEEQQLYFDDASFRVMGVPIFYLPRMRLPDPTLDRATGLLTPSLRNTDNLGIGIKLPYFVRLGDHRDLTLTPYLSTSTTTLEAIYRQAYLNGEIRVDAAVTRDDLVADTRTYLFGDGIFDLGRDVTLRFDLEYASDDAYLLEYGYSQKDRLDSEISLERVRDRTMARIALTYYSSLRAGEQTQTLPPLLGEATWERRLTPRLGGTLTYSADLQSHVRETSAPRVGTNLGGRDVARLGAGAQWHGATVTNGGFVVDGTAGFRLDYYSVNDDTIVDDTFRSTIFAQTTLRYPLMRQTARATHVIEPMVQLAWSDVNGGDVENEDSRATEFDQANLLALSRFSGQDAVETGLRGAVGLTWTRLGQAGWDSTLTIGRVFRADSDPSFSATSSLGKNASDWLVAGQLRTTAGLSLDSRVIISSGFDITKTETRAGWSGDNLDLTASYIYLPADLGEDRPNEIGELAFDTTYRFDDMWSVGWDARYDVLADEPTQTGLQIGWQNECVTVDFSVSRRFTSSTTLTPSTDFGLSIGLNGFSAGRSVDSAAHRCTN